MGEILKKIRERIAFIWKNDKTLLLKTAVAAVIFIIALVSFITGEIKENDMTEQDDVIITSGSDGADIDDDTGENSKTYDRDIIYIDVEGAVASPGVVKTPPESRVFYAVDMAGGLTDKADTSKINLAAKLSDGDKVYIPYISDDGNDGPDGRKYGYTGNKARGNADEIVNINTATMAELESVSGIGPSTARNIIDYRDKNGGFRKLTDLLEINGIGEKTFEKFKDKLCV